MERWLRALDLHEVVEFNALDADGYDRIDLPGFSFRIPHDEARLEDALCRAFPQERKGIAELFAVLRAIRSNSKDTILYGPWPVERVFEHFQLSPGM